MVPIYRNRHVLHSTLSEKSSNVIKLIQNQIKPIEIRIVKTVSVSTLPILYFLFAFFLFLQRTGSQYDYFSSTRSGATKHSCLNDNNSYNSNKNNIFQQLGNNHPQNYCHRTESFQPSCICDSKREQLAINFQHHLQSSVTTVYMFKRQKVQKIQESKQPNDANDHVETNEDELESQSFHGRPKQP